MLLYILLLIILMYILFKYLTYKEGLEITGCYDRKNIISRYPKNEHIDPLFDGIFNPRCCPSPYSNSSGCLCKDLDHSELIIMRGGNRIM